MDDNTYDFSVDYEDTPDFTGDYNYSPNDFSYVDSGIQHSWETNPTANIPEQSQGAWWMDQGLPDTATLGQLGTDQANLAAMQGFSGFGSMPGQGFLGSTQSVLNSLFGGKGVEGATRGLAALLEGSQNKKQAAALQKLVAQQQTRLDPFGSQRPQYQQELSNAVQNPYQAAIVKNQVDQIAQAQARKDAAAGRRSNMATSSPAMLAAQAQVAQNYINSLMTPAGANIAPQSAGLQQLAEASKYGTQGYISPLLSALGMGQQQNSNTAALDLLKAALTKK